MVGSFLRQSEEYLRRYVDMTDHEIASFVLESKYRHNMDPLIIELARRLHDHQNTQGRNQASEELQQGNDPVGCPN